MSIEGVAAHLSVGDNVNATSFLQGDCFIDCPVLSDLEVCRIELARFELLPCFYQVGRPEQASYYFAVIGHFHLPPTIIGPKRG